MKQGKKRVGPHRFNDTRAFDEIIRLRVNDPSLSVRAAIRKRVRSTGRTLGSNGKRSASEDADVARIHRKYLRQQYDPKRAESAPLRAEELIRKIVDDQFIELREEDRFIEHSQFFVDQDSPDWADSGRKGYSPIERMPDGSYKVQRHLRRLLTYDELCAQYAPYFATIAHLLDPNSIGDGIDEIDPA